MFVAPKHKLELFDKLISPFFNYLCEVWGFCQANAIERVHMQFCKKLLGVKKTKQNDFVYGSWEEEIMPQNEFLSSLNIGLKYYKHLKTSILKLYII